MSHCWHPLHPKAPVYGCCRFHGGQPCRLTLFAPDGGQEEALHGGLDMPTWDSSRADTILAMCEAMEDGTP